MPFGVEPMQVETGRLVKQADGAVITTIGGTTLIVAVTASSEPREGADFFPLMVDYREKFYATGRIPGGFFKRESRPGDMETLKARITDRAIRPLFPEGLRNEVMVYITIVASDGEHQAEIAALNTTSIALQLSSVPFQTPLGAVRVGRINDEFIVNPTISQMKESELDLIVAGTRSAINMVESGAQELGEDVMIEALKFGHDAIRENIDAQEKFVQSANPKAKVEFQSPKLPVELEQKLEDLLAPMVSELLGEVRTKEAFTEGEHSILKAGVNAFGEEYPDEKSNLRDAAEHILSREVRKLIIEDGKRVDGRQSTEIRPVTVERKVLPSVHGSAIFTRGQTQALGVVTLGTVGDSQMIDDMHGTYDKYFMLHYNFPPYSVGEARPMRAPGRREIGHGALAERALAAMMPDKETFPYTVRMVSEILESNGSSSMATVCVGSLAMMDAGVPLIKPVAGIAMGLVQNETGQTAVLTDIQGVEDHLGDMDFKVAGTTDGITALQMDIKVEGITFEILAEALRQAREARLDILGQMSELIDQPGEMADSAPRVITLHIPVEKIGALIGPGGKTIRGIVEKTGAKVYVSANDGNAADAAKSEVELLTAEVEVEQVYQGKVVRITDFGAFLELLPGRDGLLHVSEMSWERVDHPEDFCQLGDIIEVKVTNVDPEGKVRLSHKVLTEHPEGYVPPPDRERGPRGGGDRGRGGGGDLGRGGDRDRGNREGEYSFRERPRRNK